jgi:NADH:ubiquinone oxidoreductase subunit 2 (subunit N)
MRTGAADQEFTTIAKAIDLGRILLFFLSFVFLMSSFVDICGKYLYVAYPGEEGAGLYMVFLITVMFETIGGMVQRPHPLQKRKWIEKGEFYLGLGAMMVGGFFILEHDFRPLTGLAIGTSLIYAFTKTFRLSAVLNEINEKKPAKGGIKPTLSD